MKPPMQKISLLALSLALAGCFTAGRRGAETVPAVYDLGAAASAPAPAKGVPPLAVEVKVPAWFDSLGVEYRLRYADPTRLHDYALARWAGSPAALIQQRLVQQLGLLPLGQGGARCTLRLEVDEFSQVFDTPESSRGVLQARAIILDHGRRPLAERSLGNDQPASSQDSRGGVRALAATVDRLATDLAAWRGELAAAGKLKGCSL